MKKRGEKGLSTITITLIIILISLVAVGIVWIVVRNVIQTGAKQLNLGQFTIDAKISNVFINNSSNNVSLSVRRNAGQGEFSKLNFLFSDGKNSEFITESVSLSQLEERNFIFHLTQLNVSDLLTISIAPIFTSSSGEETIGSVFTEYNVKTGTSISFGTNNETNCTPTTCSELGYNCGIWSNGTCFGNLNCGNCTSGYFCNSTGGCQPGCSDGTPYGQCSSTKPLYCKDGILINNCTLCGCLSGQNCIIANGTCYTLKCSDGTPYGQCSSTKPLYCDPRMGIVNRCSLCGCDSGEECTKDDLYCVPILFEINPGCDSEVKVSGIDSITNCGIDCFEVTKGKKFWKRSGSTWYYYGEDSNEESSKQDIVAYWRKFNGPSCKNDGTFEINPGCDSEVKVSGIDSMSDCGYQCFEVTKGKKFWRRSYGTWYYYGEDSNEESSKQDIVAYWRKFNGPSCKDICWDQTPYSQCSPTKPLYCNGGTLISNCNLCGCPSGQTCLTNGTCIPSCIPQTCTNLGYTCGSWSDGCSGGLNCGSCSSGYNCIRGTCIPSCIPQTCSGLGKSCGTWNNGTCSGTLNCGTCSSGYNCVSGTCVAPCIPQTCGSLGKTCGTWANGTCGGTFNCGNCTSGYSCTNGTCVS